MEQSPAGRTFLVENLGQVEIDSLLHSNGQCSCKGTTFLRTLIANFWFVTNQFSTFEMCTVLCENSRQWHMSRQVQVSPIGRPQSPCAKKFLTLFKWKRIVCELKQSTTVIECSVSGLRELQIKKKYMRLPLTTDGIRHEIIVLTLRRKICKCIIDDLYYWMWTTEMRRFWNMGNGYANDGSSTCKPITDQYSHVDVECVADASKNPNQIYGFGKMTWQLPFQTAFVSIFRSVSPFIPL